MQRMTLPATESEIVRPTRLTPAIMVAENAKSTFTVGSSHFVNVLSLLLLV